MLLRKFKRLKYSLNHRLHLYYRTSSLQKLDSVQFNLKGSNTRLIWIKTITNKRVQSLQKKVPLQIPIKSQSNILRIQFQKLVGLFWLMISPKSIRRLTCRGWMFTSTARALHQKMEFLLRSKVHELIPKKSKNCRSCRPRNKIQNILRPCNLQHRYW
jgi:hypothetical protein